MTRRKGKGRQGEAQSLGTDDEGPRFVLGSAESAPAPATLDERFKQLAAQREKMKSAGLAVRRAEATERASQGRYDSLTAKRTGAPIATKGLNQVAVPVRLGATRVGGSRGRGRAAVAKQGLPVRRKDGAATVAAGFGLALPQRPGALAKKGVKPAARVGRGGGAVARGAAVGGRGGRASGAGRGGGRGRGRGGPPPSAEQLNSDLDAYFSQAKKD